MEGQVVQIAILTNFIPPYREPLFTALQQKANPLRVFVDVDMESDRPWRPSETELDVIRQKTWTIRRRQKNVHGYRDTTFLHIPWTALINLLRYRPEVVVSSEFGLRTLQACLYRLLNRRSRLIIWATLSAHTEQTRSVARGLARRFIVSVSDGVVTNGASGRDYLLSISRSPAPRVRVLGQVASPDVRAAVPPEPIATSSETPELLIVGQLIERKGLEVLFRDLSKSISSELSVRLSVLGSGPLRNRLERLALQLGLYVTFYGEVDRSSLQDHFNAARFLLFPTLADEWGLVVNEALAAGVPVVGSCYSEAVMELITHEYNGFVYDPFKADTLQSVLAAALTLSEQEYSKMRSNALESASELTPEVWAGKLIEFASELSCAGRAAR
jgi:glycosyltransferase involved in cell wall biosynthesis